MRVEVKDKVISTSFLKNKRKEPASSLEWVSGKRKSVSRIGRRSESKI